MIIQGGVIAPLAASQKAGNPNLAQGWQTELLVSELLPRYGYLAQTGLLFTAANQAGSAVTNLAATATGFILVNPLGSGKNLVLIDLLFMQTSTAAAAANAGLQLAANVAPLALSSYTLTASLTVQSGLIGSQAQSIAKALSSCTLPAAPVAIRNLWQPSVSATATTAIPPFLKDEIAGAIAVAPGCAVSLSALSALSGAASMTWAEVPA
jgi:hypothetical protein